MKMGYAYSEAIDQTLDQIVTLYSIFYTPQVLLYVDGHLEQTIEGVWSSDEAKAAFDFLTIRLKRLTEEQNKIMNQENTHE